MSAAVLMVDGDGGPRDVCKRNGDVGASCVGLCYSEWWIQDGGQ